MIHTMDVIEVVNYALPMLGLLFCISIMLIKSINTRSAICTTKLNLYALAWLILLWADWGSNHMPVFATVLVRLIIFVNNLLYVKQLTIVKPIRLRTLRWPHFKH